MTGSEFFRLGRKVLRGWTGAEYRQIDIEGVFPLDWRPHALTADEDGAVRRPSPIGSYVHPVETSFRIIANLQVLATAPNAVGADSVRNMIALGVKSLISVQMADGSFRYPVAVRRYSVSPGWSSGMAQGLAYHAFCAADPFLDQELRERTSEGADIALKHLRQAVTSGGCSDYDQEGRPFFEECPSRPLPLILNGAVFALLGLATSAQPHAVETARMAADRLAQMLPLWDLGYWSRYDTLDCTPSSPDYHNLHIELLRSLSMCYPELPFAPFADRFTGQRDDLTNRIHSYAALVANRARAQFLVTDSKRD